MGRPRGAALRFEPLERRDLLTAETVIGDAQFVLYDDAVVSTLQPEFSRGVETSDSQGDPVAADERRYGEPLHYSPVLEWTDTGVDLPGAPFKRILGVGLDHDGETPLLVYQSSGRMSFFVGEDLTLAGEIVFPDGDLAQGAYPGEKFNPRAAVVHQGLVVIAAERSVETEDGSYEVVGVDFFYTQDEGASLHRIATPDGFGPPVLEGARGMNRLERWSFQNPFPVDGLDDTTSVWLPWADYLFRADAPKGGQVGLIRADRDSPDGLWTVGLNRTVYSQWYDEDTGGLHAHTAAVTSGGLISHWGDVGYRNHTLFHRFDLENYETAPVETVFAFGGYESTPGPEQVAPQPVAAAPSPVAGEHFAGGDETPDHVLSFGAMSSLDDRLTVSSPLYQPGRDARGGVYDGAAVLHLQYVQGVGYVAEGAQDDVAYFSPDGERWTQIRPPEGGAVVWIHGDQFVSEVDGHFWTAPLPTIESVVPLSLAPGGFNDVEGAFEERTPPGEGNTLREVTYSGGAWRYADNQAPLDLQAPPPTFGDDTLVFEVTIGDQSDDLGSIWLQPPGAETDIALAHHADVWVANLGAQETNLAVSLGVSDETTGVSRIGTKIHFEVNANTQWTPTGTTLKPEPSQTGRLAMWLQVREESPGSRALVAVPYAGQTEAPTYPLAPLSGGPDEIETVPLDPLGDAWSVGLVARQPTNAPQRGDVVPLASLTGPSGDAVVWSLDLRSGSREVFVVEVYDAQQLVESRKFSTQFFRGDTFEFVVSSSTDGSRFTLYASATEIFSFEMPSLASLDLDRFQWSDRDGDVVVGVEPVVLAVDEDRAWDEAEQRDWLESSLAEKATFNARPAPGDFNSDGVVDGADYARWRETEFHPVPGVPGDANLDGFVDEIDGIFWQAQLGATGPGVAADFNDDNAVDGADYAIWRENAVTQVEPGTGADADGDGYVLPADLQAWRQALGSVYPSLEDLQAAAASAPPAASQADSPSVPEASPPLLRVGLSEPTASTRETPTQSFSTAPVIVERSALTALLIEADRIRDAETKMTEVSDTAVRTQEDEAARDEALALGETWRSLVSLASETPVGRPTRTAQ